MPPGAMSKPPRLKCLRPALGTLASPLAKARTGQQLWKPDSDRGTRHQRGYGWAWEKLRKVILERDSGLCQPCLKAERTTLATHVDHITPKSAGGTDDPPNLRAICRACHDEKTRREMTNRGGA